MAQRTASTTLRNSTIAPSPVLDDPTVMHGDDRIDQVAAKRTEPSENSILVRARKPGVADDVGDQDRR
jgi:hypothetical protein